MIRESLNGRGVANIDVLWVVGGIKGDAEWMVQAGRELFDLRGLSVGAYAAKDEDRSGSGIGKKKIAIGSGADEARHGESAAAEGHEFLVVRSLHGSGVAACIERDFEAGRSDGPCVGRARDHVRRVVHRLRGIGLGQVGESDLAANAGLLLAPIGECSLAGDGLLRR